MIRVLIVISLLVSSALTMAGQKSPLFQVDLIVFIHQQSATEQSESKAYSPSHSIALQTAVSPGKPYHLLPASSSNLRNEYWALHRKPQYQVLLHYSWLQPANNHRPIELPLVNRDGWNVAGSLQIIQSNYYLLDTNLRFSAPNDRQAPFVFAQKQRLKSGIVYYLDHPQAGMLIKVHKIS